jgi:hypothetical protein
MKKFVQINEYYDLNSSSLSEQELMGMASLNYKITGINDVIIWIGPNPEHRWKRIKISNIPNKIDDKNLFTLTIPDFKVIGDVNTKLITSKVMNQIKEWVLINLKAIEDYSDRKTTTDEFITELNKKKK